MLLPIPGFDARNWLPGDAVAVEVEDLSDGSLRVTGQQYLKLAGGEILQQSDWGSPLDVLRPLRSVRTSTAMSESQAISA